MQKTSHALPRKWFSVKQAADYLGCHTQFLNHARQAGIPVIPFARLGRHIRYDIADLDAFLENTKRTHLDSVEQQRKPGRKAKRQAEACHGNN